MKLVKIKQSENVLVDIAYATKNNFTGDYIYKAAHYDERCFYLHADAKVMLDEALKIAVSMGYKLKVFDAFRPQEAQEKLWAHTPDPEFLADPKRGSPHSRGVAIDLTLCDMDGQELDMGTGFDEFSPRSHHGHPEITGEAQRNRVLLMGIMTTAGWDFYRNEWWHYQAFNARAEYPHVFTDAGAGTGMM